MKIYADVLDIDKQVIDELSAMGLGLEYSYFTQPVNFEKNRMEYGIRMLRYARETMHTAPLVHGPFMSMKLGARDPLVKEAVSKRILHIAELSAAAGAEGMVIHAGFDHPFYDAEIRDEWARRIAGHIGEIRAGCGGLSLYIENVREPETEFFEKIFTYAPLEGVRLCLDTGHINLFGSSRDPGYWASALGNRLGMIHLNSNQGDRDSHLSHTCGSQDYEGLFELLSERGDDLKIVIEVKDRAELQKSLTDLRKRGML